LSPEQVKQLNNTLRDYDDIEPELAEDLEDVRAIYSHAATSGEAMLIALVAP
jgi:hypothetical protein